MRKTAIWLILGVLAVVMMVNYLTGALLPAFKPSNSDFSELYATSWMWRHGQNPYDPALAAAARQNVVGQSGPIYLVNVPTGLVVAAPFTLLPWGWANFVFLLLGVAGIVATILALLRLRGRVAWNLETASIVVFLLAFSPLRIAFQWGNVVLLVVPFSVLTILLAKYRRDWVAGLLLGLATCLKPQIGIWIAIYYLLRGRFKIVGPAIAVGVTVSALFFLHPIPLHVLLSSYRANLEHWFAPGGLYGFTEGSVSFNLLRTQGIFYRLVHSVAAASWMAYVLFLVFGGLWVVLLWRFREKIPSPLAVVTLIAISFLAFYHSIPDVALITLAVVDAFPQSLTSWTTLQKWICLLLFIVMLPQRSMFVFLIHHLSAHITQSWWWDLFFTRYMVWLLVALSIALLLRMREAQLEVSDFTVHNEKGVA